MGQFYLGPLAMASNPVVLCKMGCANICIVLIFIKYDFPINKVLKSRSE